MVEWLDAHQIPYDSVDLGDKGKPFCEYYIDDKGVRFNDNWAEIVAFVEKGEAK